MIEAWAAVKLFLGAAFKFLRAIPWQIYAALGVLLALWWFGHIRYEAGETAADTRHEIADKLAADARAVRAARIATKQAEVTTRVETVYVDRVKTIREAARTIIRQVPVYVPATDPPLSGGFRLLHDAAASGVPIVPVPAYIADAAAVPAQVAAGTIADNYGTCREQAEQLISLQAWVVQQQGVANGNRD